MQGLESVIGWAILAVLAALALRALWRHSRAAGILAPVLVGLALRLVVMLMAHFGSLSLGDHGILFIDDQTYFRGAQVVAGYWGDGQWVNPARYDVLGTYQVGYQLLLTGLFSLGTSSVLLGKLVNVLLGSATILLVGLIGERLLGRQAARRAAWLAALAPTLIWWTAPLLKEALATFLVTLGILAAMSLPRRRALVTLAAVAAYLMIVRGPAALALIVGAGLALLVAGKQAEGRWWSRPLRVYLLTLAVSVFVAALAISHGDLNAFYLQYDHVVHNMIHQYQGGNPLRVPYDAVKSLLTPLPWVFDHTTENWDRGLYPGVWLLFCALPLAVRGAWRLRTRPELWLFVGTAATALGINAFTSGYAFRQRSMIEPIVLLLALAGVASWRMAARWSAAALAVTAVGAGIQSHSPVVVLAIAAAAGLVFLLSRWLPGEALDWSEESTMVARLRTGVPRSHAAGAVLGHALTGLIERVAAVHGRVVRAAPKLTPREPGRPGLLATVGSAITRGAPQIASAPAGEGASGRGGRFEALDRARSAVLEAAPQAGIAEPVRLLRDVSAPVRPDRSLAAFLRSRVAAAEPEVPQTRPPEASARGGYRPALDGVRAVAVLAVIAYHFGSRASGGFLGVDVFFVLSGYLITTLLLRERSGTGHISLTRFWARRARRLLPAVLILVTVVALMTAHLGQVGAYGARRADMIGTIFYYANWHFIAAGQSYFAQFTGISPLEHMWSLAIEEQFYLVWPLLVLGVLLLARRGARTLLWLTIAAAVASAVWMIAAYDETNPTRSYFGTDTRAHALLVGAALAAVLFLWPRLLESQRMRRAATWLGLAVALLVAAAFVAMKDQTGFYYAGGSFVFALVVAAGLFALEVQPGSPLGRVLSFRPVVWIGTISYGLYLWHWPIIVWLRGSSSITDARAQQALGLVLTFAAAALSFYLVERPIRSGRAPWVGLSAARLARAMAVAAVLVIVIVVQSTSLGSSSIAKQINDVGGRDCPSGSPSPAPRFFWCTRVKPASAAAPDVAVVGDSTALALNAGMETLARKRGFGYIQAGKNGCSLLPLSFPNHPERAADVAEAARCITGVSALLKDVAARRHPDVWLVSDRWSLLPMRDSDGKLLQPGDPRRRREILAAWRTRLKELTANGAKVVLVLTPPPGPPVECATKKPAPAECASGTYTTADPQTRFGASVARRAAAGFRPDVAVVSVDDVVCPDNGRCPAAVDGVLTRYDGIHYTATFSRRVLDAVLSRAQRAGIPLGPS